jgi:hypothetical protein
MLSATSLRIKKHAIVNQATKVIHTQAAFWNLPILVYQAHVGPMLSVQFHHRDIPCVSAKMEHLAIPLALQAVEDLSAGQTVTVQINLPALHTSVVTHVLDLVV